MIKTKYGNAEITPNGYLQITSSKEGNHKKFLHRLVFEDFYQTKLPSNIAIHHEDGDKTNNKIWNLIPMTLQEHSSLHNKGRETTLEHGINLSKNQNTTGFYRVSKKKCKTCKQGYRYIYVYYVDGKQKWISSIDINTLKLKVLKNGLEWIELNGGDESEICN